MSGRVAIRNARLVDPAAGTIRDGDVLIEGARIASLGGVDHATVKSSDVVADARGRLVAPGLVDFGVMGFDMAACVAGGITSVGLMPDQSPPLDTPALVRQSAGAGLDRVDVHPFSAATVGLTGADLAELGLMRASGARIVATGRTRIANSGVMHRLLSYAAALDLLVVVHAEDEGLTAGAVATAGETATRLGLAAAPAAAEWLAVSRDIALAQETGARLHFRQVTTARGLDLVRRAKADGLPVSCGITPAHLFLSDIAITGFRTFARLSPPLRGEADRRAALAAIADGTIDLICSGHDPQGPEAKRLPFADAAPGMSGAETLLALSLALVRDEVIDMPRLFALLSTNPARLLGLDAGRLVTGAPADLVLVDPDAPWRIDADRMAGRAGNTPFDALPVQGKVLRTIKSGVPLD